MAKAFVFCVESALRFITPLYRAEAFIDVNAVAIMRRREGIARRFPHG
jgi:hypothetical protein